MFGRPIHGGQPPYPHWASASAASRTLLSLPIRYVKPAGPLTGGDPIGTDVWAQPQGYCPRTPRAPRDGDRVRCGKN